MVNELTSERVDE